MIDSKSSQIGEISWSKSSRLILSTLTAAIDSVKPEPLVKRAVKFRNSELTVRDIYGNVEKLRNLTAYILSVRARQRGYGPCSFPYLG